MDDFFESHTQYDDMYTHIAHGKFHKKRSACSLFALQTAYHFQTSGSFTADDHAHNLDIAIANYIEMGLTGFMDFRDLIAHSNIGLTELKATSVNLVLTNEIGFDQMFKHEGYDDPYSVIFLKNSKFFTVLYDPICGYAVRDCHETHQYNFMERTALIDHLCKTYNFMEEIVVDGIALDEYSSIEFLVINAIDAETEFETDINQEASCFPDDVKDNFGALPVDGDEFPIIDVDNYGEYMYRDAMSKTKDTEKEKMTQEMCDRVMAVKLQGEINSDMISNADQMEIDRLLALELQNNPKADINFVKNNDVKKNEIVKYDAKILDKIINERQYDTNVLDEIFKSNPNYKPKDEKKEKDGKDEKKEKDTNKTIEESTDEITDDALAQLLQNEEYANRL
jgi:hypothetical protein